jgi:hypothetical protein
MGLFDKLREGIIHKYMFLLIAILLPLVISLSACGRSYKSPDTFADFEKEIKKEYRFVKYVSIRGGTPVSATLLCELKELKEADEIEELANKLKAYIVDSDTLDALNNPSGFSEDSYSFFHYTSASIRDVYVSIEYVKNNKTTFIFYQRASDTDDFSTWKDMPHD